MDFWDPALINALAISRQIILLDNAGIGKSDGEVPTTFQGWAGHVVDFIEALNIHQIDLLGYVIADLFFLLSGLFETVL